jgi:hypothetical protein
MATSKIKRIEKILNDDGTHSIYNSQHGDFYEFIIEMENGDVGKASAKGEDFKYPIGKEVTYEKKVYPSKFGDKPDLVLIKSIKPIEMQGGSYNNPESNNKGAMSMAINNALKAIEKHDVKIEKLHTIFMAANLFYAFITEEKNDRNTHLDRYHAIEHAIEIIAIDDLCKNEEIPEDLSTIEKILLMAKIVYERISSVAKSD